MKIALLGYGKMGKTIQKLIEEEKKHRVILKIDLESANELTLQKLSEADVAIEFTSPNSVLTNIKKCFEANVPIVVGTTGWHNHLDKITAENDLNKIALLHASNFSVGVNLFYKINKYVANLMDTFSDYDLKIEETHHTEKQDAPSGTAISLANQIIKQQQKFDNWQLGAKGEENEIPIIAFRKHDNKGEHSIIYSSNIDEIEIRHQAKSRAGFAKGAIKAAEWLVNKKGIYTFDDVIDEILETGGLGAKV